MAITRPIPKVCKPVVRKLQQLPLPTASKWEGDPGAMRCYVEYCPMGLHPDAEATAPTDAEDFHEGGWGGTRAVEKFAEWWDEQLDARAALAAILSFEL